MLIEPASVEPRRGGRLRLLAALLAPPVILAAVVGGAVLGGSGSAPSDARRSAAAVAASSASSPVDAMPRATQPPGILGQPGLAVRPVVLPTSVSGLAVRSVAGATGDELHGRTEGLVAIGGWLSFVGAVGACPPSSAVSDDVYCQRELILADDRLVDDQSQALHPIAMPGVFIPWSGRDDYRTMATPVQVVVVGVFGETRAGGCFVEGKPCGPSLVIELVVWVDGHWRRYGSQLGPDIAVADVHLTALARHAIRARNVAGGGSLLIDVAVRPSTLNDIDPEAAASLGPAPPSIVWYARMASRPLAGGQPGVAWLVLDDATGRILAGWDPSSRIAWPR